MAGPPKTTLWVPESLRRNLQGMKGKNGPRKEDIDTVAEVIRGLIVIAEDAGVLTKDGRPRDAGTWRVFLKKMEENGRQVP